MQKLILPGLFGILFLGIYACQAPEPDRILIFSKTAGDRHPSIPAGRQALLDMAAENQWVADTTENPEFITEENLQRYRAVLFLNSSGNFLNSLQKADLQRYMQAGGGIVGVHSACETEPDWPWFQEMIGAKPTGHTGVKTGRVAAKDQKHPAVKKWTEPFSWTDDGYAFSVISPDAQLLATLEADGKEYPISWARTYDGGRFFYTALGHSDPIFQDARFVEHLQGAIRYAMGAGGLDYTKATTPRSPDESRLVKVPLVDSVWVEPMEMAILPNLDILVIQRRGEVMLYNQATRELSQAAKLSVYHTSEDPKINAEQGLLGIVLDPDFDNNHFVYLFYSPADKEVNRLSRFVFRDQKLDVGSEKMILEFYSDRSICCHTGGSMAFGPNRVLFLSTGDNTAPTHQRKDQVHPDDYAALDNRPEYSRFDGSGKSGNTNDLQGKILRIRVNEDGSYDIPDGNLYPKGEPGTRPEVYVMGARNPFRIALDSQTGYLYWGDVGPDAEEDDPTWGSKGYDEINQTRRAGNFGWPFFIGNNYPYRDYDFVKEQKGELFDPLRPVNNTQKNTGKRELPPAQGAFIWYPYDESAEFPQLGTGGRNAMAGPVYRMSDYPAETRLPAAYDGKFFIYEWMRDWIKMVNLDSAGNYAGMEPFMPSVKFSHPIDLEIGPDGRLYVLEYGEGWYSGNMDSGLYRIDFTSGNRPPKAKLTADRTSGGLPLTVRFSAAGSEDPDGGQLSYIWDFGDGQLEETTSAVILHTFDKVGDYAAYLTAVDNKGAATKVGPFEVYAGNESPQLAIQLEGNRQFYFPGRPLNYKLVVTDKEDGKLEGNGIPAGQVELKLDYLTRTKPVLGHQTLSEIEKGKQFMEESDCGSCHKTNEKSVGPTYTEISARYQDRKDAVEYLSGKIIHGGSGVWGASAMSAHPALKPAMAESIANYILSLAKDESRLTRLPASGVFNPDQGRKTDPRTVVVLKAHYTDRGGPSARALQSTAFLELSYPKIEAEGVQSRQNMTDEILQKEGVAKTTAAEGWMSYPPCDFTGVKRIRVRYGLADGKTAGYELGFYLDGQEGVPIATTTVGAGESSGRFYEKTLDFKAPEDGKLHTLQVKYRKLAPAEKGSLGIEGYLLE